MGAFFRNGFAQVDNVTPVIKIITWHYATNHTGLRNLPNPASGTYANTRRNSPELSRTFQDLPEPTFRNFPAYTGTLRNLPELASGTYTILHRNSPEPSEPASGTYTSIRRNLPEPSGTFRNLPEPASGTYTSTRPNSPEPPGTFQNLPPELAPMTRTSTHRSLSGLKTPLAYAVGEKLININIKKINYIIIYYFLF